MLTEEERRDKYIGQKVSDIQTYLLESDVRIINEDMNIITNDFNPGRYNFVVDSDGIVTDFYTG